jgi:EAL domain-containing protein (putative c-di-GMP-specific phosphodiesterase class I)
MEALARFTHAPDISAETVFAEAHAAGYGPELEIACLRAALDRRRDMPHGTRLAVNLSPDALQDARLGAALDQAGPSSFGADLDNVIIEVTEHAAKDPDQLREQFAQLRLRGAAIAVDDVGTGYAGLLRLATMRPDFVKIDRTIVTGARDSAAQQAVLEALVTFAHGIGAVTIGEGVETLDDLVVLTEFDVDFAQGYAIGKPAFAPRQVSRLVAATCRRTRRQVLQRRAAGSTAGATFGMHAATSALSEAAGLPELNDAVNLAAVELGIDVICVSLTRADGTVREIATTNNELDPAVYRLTDYPATRVVLETSNTVEAHLSDATTDSNERRLMRALGYASLLMIPLTVDGASIGLLEFAHRTPRRWTSQDIAHGRGLARHISQALPRIMSLVSELPG